MPKFHRDVIKQHHGKLEIIGMNLDFIGIEIDDIKYIRILLECDRTSSR